MTNIWVVIQEHCLKIIHYHRIKVSIIESPDIELLCCIKNIDLYIGRRMIAMRQKSTSKIMKLSLDLENIGTWLSGNRVVNFDSYWSHSKCYIILSYIVAKFSWGIVISSQVELNLFLQTTHTKFGMIDPWWSQLLTVKVKSMTVRADNSQHAQIVILYISLYEWLSSRWIRSRMKNRRWKIICNNSFLILITYKYIEFYYAKINILYCHHYWFDLLHHLHYHYPVSPVYPVRICCQ